MSTSEWLVVLLVLILILAWLWAIFDIVCLYKKEVLDYKDKESKQ